MSYRGTGAAFAWEAFVRNNATTGKKPPAPYPLSACWWAYYETLADTYCTLFGMGPRVFSGGDYWCCSIGPWGSGSANTFAMSANSLDVDSGLPFSGMTSQWIPQGVIVWKDATTARHRFYPDLRRPSLVGIQDIALPYFTGLQADTIFFMGAPPWANQEGVDGSIGNIKIWQARLSSGDLLREVTSPYPVVPRYSSLLYGAYPARQAFKATGSPADILIDVSGKANHFFQPTTADTWDNNPGAGAATWANPPAVNIFPQRRPYLGLLAAGSAPPAVYTSPLTSPLTRTSLRM